MPDKPKDLQQYWALYDFLFYLERIGLISHKTRVCACGLITYPHGGY